MKRRNNRRVRFSDEKGNILVLAAVSLFSMLGFASLAIDAGCVLTAKNQLQSAADASALSGASGLMENRAEAVRRAVLTGGNNACLSQAVLIAQENVDFPAADRIRVRAERDVPLYFARLFGVQSVRLSAAAVAELGTIVGTPGMRPWAVPDMNWSKGTSVVIKSGSLGAPATNPSFYYPVDFPPLNTGNPETGAAIYELNIVEGTRHTVGVGDVVQVEPGNMVGPTRQGVDALMAMDPDAFWNGSEIEGSAFPGTASPRVVKIPLYDPDDPPDSGRNSVTVTSLASFFITGIQGGNVIGVFMEKITSGRFGTGNTMLKGVRLVS